MAAAVHGACKIWGGQAQIATELNQLLDRYVTWSATKAAMIYLHRGQNTTEVVEHLAKQIGAHKCAIHPEPKGGPTHLRFRFHHPSDRRKEFDLAVLVLPVRS